MAADVNPNVITGLSSGMDTKAIVNQMIAAQRKKVEPVIARKEEKQLQLDAWKQVETQMKTVRAASDTIAKKSLWEGKIVSSSHPDIIEAFATSGAKPGKHTIMVDKLALEHQIASQSYESEDDSIGQGDIRLIIGEQQEQRISIDETNDTLKGFVDAVNALDTDIAASIIKTGNKETPYQVLLRSLKTGKEGEIFIDTRSVRGSGPAEVKRPTLDPY